jgi:hypothetical protein
VHHSKLDYRMAEMGQERRIGAVRNISAVGADIVEPSVSAKKDIRRTGVAEYWIGTAASVRLDVEGPDDVAPLLGFLSDELAEGRGRAGKNRAAQLAKPRLKLGIGEACIDFLVELVHDLGGRGLRCADAVPEARLISWHELSEGRSVWQRFRARLMMAATAAMSRIKLKLSLS